MTAPEPGATETIVDRLRAHAAVRPDDLASAYIGEDGEERARYTWAALDTAARAVGARLQGLGGRGRSALVLYPPGLDFLTGFLGCLYAETVAIPLPVPRPKRSAEQFASILDSTAADLVLCTAQIERSLRPRLEEAGIGAGITWLATEDTDAEIAAGWRAPDISPEALAYLQYTSGSTSDRKGVMITHANVMENIAGIDRGFAHDPDSVTVSWLPHFHDLGLVAGILQPLRHGHPGIVLSPTAFVQRPHRWLEAITRYRGTHACSPNFGYDLCVRRVSDAQREQLDLSSWKVALNGAEPVRPETLTLFTEKFRAQGFRPETFYPAYGLAEATLVVSGGACDAAPISLAVSIAGLESDRAVPPTGPADERVLIGCGGELPETSIAIVDPDRCTAKPEREVGEIWVSGPGVADGYLGLDAENEATFRARIAGGPAATRYLRTGDLGFLDRGELYVTGRLKDLIIIRGSNHYPQDLEWTVEQCHPAIRPGCGAAFSVEIDGEERLVIATEIEREAMRHLDADAVFTAIRAAVSEEHELALHAAVLLRTGTVPRTSSGKIQRRRCRALFLEGGLQTVAEMAARAPGTADATAPEPAATSATGPAGAPAAVAAAAPQTPEPAAAGADDLVGWLREYAGTRLNSRLMDERRSMTPNVVLDFGNHGILGLEASRDFGGLGLDAQSALRVVEQLGAIDQTLTMFVIVHNVLGIRPIERFATPERRAELLPRLATGRELVAFAITEPGAGSNPKAIAASAVPDPAGGWRLNGSKVWSGTAGWAGVINVFAQSRTSAGEASGISGFTIDRDRPGLRIGDEALTMGMRAMVQNAVHLEDVPVSAHDSLGVPGGGMAVAQDAMMGGRLAIGAACVGGIKRCLQIMRRYAAGRTVSTGRLLDNPVTTARLGAIAAAVTALESLTAAIARRLDAGREVPVEGYIACKTAGPEWFWLAADTLVQTLGGRGYIETNVAPQLLRDARVARILEGPTEALSMFLGSRVLSHPDALHDFMAEAFDAGPLALALIEGARTIAARCGSGATRFGDDPPRARRWGHSVVGDLATQALLLAAVDAAHAAAPTPARGRSAGWARTVFERSLDSVLAGDVREAGVAPLADLEAEIDAHTDSIGDVMQSLAGEGVTPDPAVVTPPPRAPGTRPPPGAQPPDPPQPSAAPPVRPAPTSSTTPAPAAAKTPSMPASPPSTAPVAAAAGKTDETALMAFITDWLAGELRVAQASINPDRSIFDYGLDSVTAVLLAASLEDHLGLSLRPEIAYDYPEVRALARHLMTVLD